jgi:hypothetical protein
MQFLNITLMNKTAKTAILYPQSFRNYTCIFKQIRILLDVIGSSFTINKVADSLQYAEFHGVFQ